MEADRAQQARVAARKTALALGIPAYDHQKVIEVMRDATGQLARAYRTDARQFRISR